MIYNGTLNDYRKVCNSCTIYLILFVIFFIISISIGTACFYFHWYLKKVIVMLILVLKLKHRFIRHINEKYIKINIKDQSH